MQPQEWNHGSATSQTSVEHITRGSRPGFLLAIGMVVAAVVALGAWQVLGEDNDLATSQESAEADTPTADGDTPASSATTTTTSPAPIEGRYVVIDPAPTGFGAPVLYALSPEMRAEMDDGPNITFDVYGDSDSDDPFADSDLFVLRGQFESAEEAAEEASYEEQNNEPAAEVDGIKIWAEPEWSDETAVFWYDGDRTLSLAVSLNFDQDQVVDQVTDLILFGSPQTDHLHLLAQDRSFDDIRGQVGFFAQYLGHVMYSASEDRFAELSPAADPFTELIVSVAPIQDTVMDPNVAHYARRVMAFGDDLSASEIPEPQPIMVGDIEATITDLQTMLGDETKQLTVPFDDGYKVRITANASQEELVAWALAVRWATQDELEAMPNGYDSEFADGPDAPVTTTTVLAPPDGNTTTVLVPPDGDSTTMPPTTTLLEGDPAQPPETQTTPPPPDQTSD